MSAALAPELLRVGVLASGTGTNLQALFDRVHGQLVEVVAVASDQVDAQALVRAQRRSVPTAVFAKQAYVSRQQRDLALADWLQSQGVQLVVLAGYMQLVDGAFLRRFPQAVINIHPSLLPPSLVCERSSRRLLTGSRSMASPSTTSMRVSTQGRSSCNRPLRSTTPKVPSRCSLSCRWSNTSCCRGRWR